MLVASLKHDLVCITEVSIEESEKVSEIGIIRRPFAVFLKSLHSSLLSILFILLSPIHLLCLLFEALHCLCPVSMSSIVDTPQAHARAGGYVIGAGVRR